MLDLVNITSQAVNVWISILLLFTSSYCGSWHVGHLHTFLSLHRHISTLRLSSYDSSDYALLSSSHKLVWVESLTTGESLDEWSQLLLELWWGSEQSLTIGAMELWWRSGALMLSLRWIEIRIYLFLSFDLHKFDISFNFR